MKQKRVYDDGVHYVSPALDTDRHPLRWIVKSYRAADIKTNRRYETKDKAVTAAEDFTKQAIAQSPIDRSLFEQRKPTRAEKAAAKEQERQAKLALATRQREATAASKAQEEQDKAARRIAKREANAAAKEEGRQTTLAKRAAQAEAKIERAKLERFATTHFHCIRANPVAQVWQCVSMDGERKPVGRRKTGGRAPDQAPVRHAKLECAVLLGKEPLRDDAGRVIVFRNWQDAEVKAIELYEQADEEERIFWQEPEGKVVGRTMEVEIIFDPAVNGTHRPFNLWFYNHNKPYYRAARAKSLITPAKDSSGRSYQPQSADDRAAHDFNRTIERMAQEDQRMLSMEVAKFRTIWEAEAEAIRLEKEYFGNGNYYR